MSLLTAALPSTPGPIIAIPAAPQSTSFALNSRPYVCGRGPDVSHDRAM